MVQLLGIDLGTSSVKALLVEAENGRVVGRGSAEYPIHNPQPGYAEQDPGEWWRAVGLAIRAALASASATAKIAGIGLSGQMHGTLLLDAQNRLLSPAVVWPDQRSREQVREITDRIGAERLIEITGSPLATGFQAGTLRWFQQNQAEIWKQVSKVLLPKDYLRWILTSEFASDPSDGSGALLLDVLKRDWSVRLLENLDINPEVMPPIQPSIKIAGNLGAEAAELLGLPPGLPVSTGAADTACSLLGAGVVRSETLLVSISTGGQLIQPIETPEIDRSGRTHTFCSALEPGSGQSSWYRMGATLSAGQSLRWLRDKIFALEGEDVYARLTAMAEQVPIGARGLIFLPYLSGERTPLMDPSARALFLGLSLAHGQAELVRAVMEGVTLSLYDAYSALADTDTPPKRIILVGGGARSRLWQQMVADVFGLPVWPLWVAEQSALGATWLAGVGVGLFAADSVSSGWAGLGTSIDPDPAHHERYIELLDLFRRAYLKLRIGSRPNSH